LENVPTDHHSKLFNYPYHVFKDKSSDSYIESVLIFVPLYTRSLHCRWLYC